MTLPHRGIATRGGGVVGQYPILGRECHSLPRIGQFCVLDDVNARSPTDYPVHVPDRRKGVADPFEAFSMVLAVLKLGSVARSNMWQHC